MKKHHVVYAHKLTLAITTHEATLHDSKEIVKL